MFEDNNIRVWQPRALCRRGLESWNLIIRISHGLIHSNVTKETTAFQENTPFISGYDVVMLQIRFVIFVVVAVVFFRQLSSGAQEVSHG